MHTHTVKGWRLASFGQATAHTQSMIRCAMRRGCQKLIEAAEQTQTFDIANYTTKTYFSHISHKYWPDGAASSKGVRTQRAARFDPLLNAHFHTGSKPKKFHFEFRNSKAQPK